MDLIETEVWLGEMLLDIMNNASWAYSKQCAMWNVRRKGKLRQTWIDNNKTGHWMSCMPTTLTWRWTQQMTENNGDIIRTHLPISVKSLASVMKTTTTTTMMTLMMMMITKMTTMLTTTRWGWWWWWWWWWWCCCCCWWWWWRRRRQWWWWHYKQSIFRLDDNLLHT